MARQQQPLQWRANTHWWRVMTAPLLSLAMRYELYRCAFLLVDYFSHFLGLDQIVNHLLALLKREVLDLIEDMGTMKLWIQLNIPRIEDGNNFGVSIQEETVSELSRAEDAGFAVLESMTKYFFSRAKLVSRACDAMLIVFLLVSRSWSLTFHAQTGCQVSSGGGLRAVRAGDR
jgi:hypothetical protein